MESIYAIKILLFLLLNSGKFEICKSLENSKSSGLPRVRFISIKSDVPDMKIQNISENSFLLPVSFTELSFDCLHNGPTDWFFPISRAVNGVIKDVQVSKERRTSNISDPNSFIFNSEIKILFNHPAQFSTFGCRDLNNRSNINWVTSYSSRDSQISFTIKTPSDLVRVGGKDWFGNNLYCALKIWIDLSTEKFACSDHQNDLIYSRTIECGNPDECQSVFKMEKDNCRNELKFQCNLRAYKNTERNTCSDFKMGNKPKILLCGEVIHTLAKLVIKPHETISRNNSKNLYLPMSDAPYGANNNPVIRSDILGKNGGQSQIGLGQIDQKDKVRITSGNVTNGGVYYDEVFGEFSCIGSMYFFSLGFQFGLVIHHYQKEVPMKNKIPSQTPPEDTDENGGNVLDSGSYEIIYDDEDTENVPLIKTNAENNLPYNSTSPTSSAVAAIEPRYLGYGDGEELDNLEQLVISRKKINYTLAESPYDRVNIKVLCFGPIWNSQKYITHLPKCLRHFLKNYSIFSWEIPDISFDIIRSSKPEIFDSDLEEIHYGKIPKLACNFTGQPPPTMTWFKNDDQLLRGNKQYSLKFGGNWTELYFRAGFAYGSFSCKAENTRGSLVKRFHIRGTPPAGGAVPNFVPNFVVPTSSGNGNGNGIMNTINTGSTGNGGGVVPHVVNQETQEIITKMSDRSKQTDFGLGNVNYPWILGPYASKFIAANGVFFHEFFKNITSLAINTNYQFWQF